MKLIIWVWPVVLALSIPLVENSELRKRASSNSGSVTSESSTGTNSGEIPRYDWLSRPDSDDEGWNRRLNIGRQRNDNYRRENDLEQRRQRPRLNDDEVETVGYSSSSSDTAGSEAQTDETIGNSMSDDSEDQSTDSNRSPFAVATLLQEDEIADDIDEASVYSYEDGDSIESESSGAGSDAATYSHQLLLNSHEHITLMREIRRLDNFAHDVVQHPLADDHLTRAVQVFDRYFALSSELMALERGGFQIDQFWGKLDRLNQNIMLLQNELPELHVSAMDEYPPTATAVPPSESLNYSAIPTAIAFAI